MGKWEMVQIGEVCTLKSGTSLSVDKISSEGDIPYVKVADLNLRENTPYITMSSSYASNEIAKKQIFPTGTVIFPKRGGAIGTNKKRLAKREFCADLNIMGVIPTPKLHPHYLYSFFQTVDLASLQNGSSVPQINNGDIAPLSIPLPPLDVQEKIADILDRAAALIETRKAQIAKLDLLVKSWFVEMFGNPVTNPMGFDFVSLSEVAEIVSGVTKGRKILEEQVIQVPYMRVANVKDGYVDLSDVKYIDATATELYRYRLIADDVLMTEGGDPDKLGRGALWGNAIEDCIHQNHVFRVRLNKKIIAPIFFAEYLKHQSAKMYFLSCAKQTTGIASVNMTQLKAMPTPIPPLSLQYSFVKNVHAIEKLKSELQCGMSKLELLYKSLMQKCFNGDMFA